MFGKILLGIMSGKWPSFQPPIVTAFDAKVRPKSVQAESNRAAPYDLRAITKLVSSPSCKHLVCRSFGSCVLVRPSSGEQPKSILDWPRQLDGRPVSSAPHTLGALPPATTFDRAVCAAPNGSRNLNKTLGNSSSRDRLDVESNGRLGLGNEFEGARACSSSSEDAVFESNGDNRSFAPWNPVKPCVFAETTTLAEVREFEKNLSANENTQSGLLDIFAGEPPGADTSPRNALSPFGHRRLGLGSSESTFNDLEDLSPFVSRQMQTTLTLSAKKVVYLDATPKLHSQWKRSTAVSNANRFSIESIEPPCFLPKQNSTLAENAKQLGEKKWRTSLTAMWQSWTPTEATLPEIEQLAFLQTTATNNRLMFPTTANALKEDEGEKGGNTPVNTESETEDFQSTTTEAEQQPGESTGLSEVADEGKQRAKDDNKSKAEEHGKDAQKASDSKPASSSKRTEHPKQAVKPKSTSSVSQGGTLHEYKIPKIQLHKQQEDSLESNAHAILRSLVQQGTVTSDMIDSAIAASPDPRLSQQSSNQSDWLKSITPWNKSVPPEQPKSPRQLVDETFAPNTVNKLRMATAKPEVLGEINCINMLMKGEADCRSDAQRILNFTRHARQGDCRPLKKAIEEIFATEAEPSNFGEFMEKLKNMREVNPVELIQKEIDSRDMYQTNYMRLLAELCKMVPREHISESEICNMIRLKAPEAVQKGLEDNMVHMKAAGFTPTALQALGTAETFRLACSEARQADRAHLKRPASGYQHQEQPKRKSFEKQPYVAREKPPQAPQASSTAASPKKKPQFKKPIPGIAPGDPNWQCRNHRRWGDAAHGCLDTENCTFKPKRVNTLAAAAAQESTDTPSTSGTSKSASKKGGQKNRSG